MSPEELDRYKQDGLYDVDTPACVLDLVNEVRRLQEENQFLRDAVGAPYGYVLTTVTTEMDGTSTITYQKGPDQ